MSILLKAKKPWRHHHMADHAELVPITALEGIHQLTSGYQQARKPEEQEYVHRIAKNVKKHGIRNPIRLGKNRHGEPRIVDGEHRLLVGHILGLGQLPAYYHDPETEDKGKPTHKLSQIFRKQDVMAKSGLFLKAVTNESAEPVRLQNLSGGVTSVGMFLQQLHSLAHRKGLKHSKVHEHLGKHGIDPETHHRLHHTDALAKSKENPTASQLKNAERQKKYQPGKMAKMPAKITGEPMKALEAHHALHARDANPGVTPEHAAMHAKLHTLGVGMHAHDPQVAKAIHRKIALKTHRELHEAGVGHRSITHQQIHTSLKRLDVPSSEHHATIAASVVKKETGYLPAVKEKQVRDAVPRTKTKSGAKIMPHVSAPMHHEARFTEVAKVGATPRETLGGRRINPVHPSWHTKPVKKGFGVFLKAFSPPKPGKRAPVHRQPWEMSCDEFCHPGEPKPLAGNRLLFARVADGDAEAYRQFGIPEGVWASTMPGEPVTGTHVILSVPEYDDRVQYFDDGAMVDRGVPPGHVLGVDPAMANSAAPEGPRRLSYYRKHPYAETYHEGFIRDALNAGHRVPDHVREAHPHVRRH